MDGARRAPRGVSTATSSHSGGTHARCVITLVRRSGPSVSCADSSRRLAERLHDVLDLDVLARPLDCVNGGAQCRSQSLPSRRISSSDAGRPPRAGGVVREGAAGLAPTPR